MATKLYFDPDSNVLRGTFPAAEQSATTASWTATGANTLRQLTRSKYGLAGQSSITGTCISSTALQTGFIGFFCSQPLKGSQTVGGGNIAFNCADSTGTLNANFWASALNIYVWRPSNGTKVGTIRDSAGASLGGTRATVATQIQVTDIPTITSTGIAALDRDVVIVEVWAAFTSSMGSATTCGFYYGGSVENTTENTVVTSQASYIQFNENLKFYDKSFVCL